MTGVACLEDGCWNFASAGVGSLALPARASQTNLHMEPGQAGLCTGQIRKKPTNEKLPMTLTRREFVKKSSLTLAFSLAGGVTLLLVLLTVSYQAIRIALVNPVKILRSE